LRRHTSFWAMRLQEMAEPPGGRRAVRAIGTIEAMRAEVAAIRSRGQTIEFVPTMGALHDGHLSLVRMARNAGGCVVVSIFVNPTQFGPNEDFDTYPRNLKGDLEILEGEDVGVLFAPSASKMYPGGEIETTVDPGPIGTIVEGRYRPGHFNGVATVCVKLFNIVQPDRVYLGQKDAQQVAVLRRVVADLDLPVELVVGPTVRERDGLAMSSRNAGLDSEGREAATVLYRALVRARRMVEEGHTSAEELKAAAAGLIERQPGVRVQYVEVVDPRTFRPEDRITAESLMVLAAFVGSVRLIDNMSVGTGEPA
jgi:pantoate--beta-alanine ligase